MNARSRDAAAPRLATSPTGCRTMCGSAISTPTSTSTTRSTPPISRSSRVSLVKDKANGLMPEGFGWVLVRLDIHFRYELHWPGTIELGLAVHQLGRTSVHFDQAVFCKDVCVASARSITVLVDAASRKPAPLPERGDRQSQTLAGPGLSAE